MSARHAGAPGALGRRARPDEPHDIPILREAERGVPERRRAGVVREGRAAVRRDKRRVVREAEMKRECMGDECVGGVAELRAVEEGRVGGEARGPEGLDGRFEGRGGGGAGVEGRVVVDGEDEGRVEGDGDGVGAAAVHGGWGRAWGDFAGRRCAGRA